MTLTRSCTKCFLQKPIEEFGWKDRTINKRHAVCKECTAKRSSEWYYKNREHHIQNVAGNSKSYRDQAGAYMFEYLSTHPVFLVARLILSFLSFTTYAIKVMMLPLW
jgi:hypothetical protein